MDIEVNLLDWQLQQIVGSIKSMVYILNIEWIGAIHKSHVQGNYHFYHRGKGGHPKGHKRF